MSFQPTAVNSNFPNQGDVKALYTSHKALLDLKSRFKTLEEDNQKLRAQIKCLQTQNEDEKQNFKVQLQMLKNKNETLIQSLRQAKIIPNNEKQDSIPINENGPSDLELEQLLEYCMSQMKSIERSVDRQNKQMKALKFFTSSGTHDVTGVNQTKVTLRQPLSDSSVIYKERTITPMQCSDGIDPQGSQFDLIPIMNKCASDFSFSKRRSEVLRVNIPRETPCRRVQSSREQSDASFSTKVAFSPEQIQKVLVCPYCSKSYPKTLFSDFEKHVHEHVDEEDLNCIFIQKHEID